MSKKKDKEEGNLYDKIFKENVDATIDSFIHKILKINIKEAEKIVVKLQRTKEREADFLKIITNHKGEKFILHIEYQVSNDHEMVHRMIDYWNLLVSKHNLRVEQYVIFLGDEKPTMKTKVDYSNMKFHYRLVNFKDINARLFLKSNVPEEMILAVLGNFKNESSSQIVYEVVKRIEQSKPQTLEKQKIFQQLLVLGRLRKLELNIQQVMDSISQYIKIEEDVLYLKGIEAQKRQFVISLLNGTDFSAEKIANLASVSIEFVEQMKAENK
jgi:hypothetical protein